MLHRFCVTAVIGVSLAVSAPARAACTPELATALKASNFSAEQVVQICASLQPPEATGEENSPALTGGTDGSRFNSDVLDPELGNDETWKKFLVDGNYTLQNKSNPGSGLIVLSTRPDGGWRSIATRVRFTHELVEQGLVGAALAYEPGGSGGDVIVFALQTDGTISATRISDGNFIPLQSRKDAAFVVADWTYVDLAVRKRDGTTEFLVNGVSTGLTAPYDSGGGGSFGIAVFGIGGFEFNSFLRETG